MLNDFELVSHSFPKGTDVTILPVSDVHLGASEHMERDWQDFCDKVLKSPNIYITLGGDLINNGTKTSVTNCFDEKYRPREQKRIMVEMLEPIKDRILCSVSGNHERRNKDVDDDPAYDIMCKLDLEHLYRENMAFIKINIGGTSNRTSSNYRMTYCLCVTHGSGGGVLTGSAVNRNERFAYVIDGLDCLIVGHTHKPFVTQPSKIKIDPFNNKVSFRPFKVVSSTSWLSYGGYAAQKMLLPTSFAPQTVTLTGNHKEIIVTM